MKHTWIYFLLGGLITLYACNSNDEPELPKVKPEPRLSKVDSLALVKIYQTADGDNWKNGKWNLKDFKTWTGISAYLDTIHNEYRVFELYVRATSEAHGTLSPSLGELTELRYLTFTDANNITGEIPKSISKLVNLREMNITNTSCTGGIPKEIFLLPQLKWINLYNNEKLGGELPQEIALVEDPEAIFDFCNCGLSGKIPDNIKIRIVRLWYNKYTEFPFHYCLQEQTTLSMKHNFISGEIPDYILNNEKALKALHIMTLNQLDGCTFSNAPEWW